MGHDPYADRSSRGSSTSCGSAARLVDRRTQVRAVATRARRGVPRATARRRALPRGRRRGRLVWNRPDPSNGQNTLLQVERAGGACARSGAARSWSIRSTRSTRTGGHGARTCRPGRLAGAERASDASAEEIAVIVGDFQTSAEAEAVVTAIRRAYPRVSRSTWSTRSTRRWRSARVSSGPCCTCPSDADATRRSPRSVPRLPRTRRTAGS